LWLVTGSRRFDGFVTGGQVSISIIIIDGVAAARRMATQWIAGPLRPYSIDLQ
jgi:hypothetical protein